MLKYECGECSREHEEGMFGLCNGVLDVIYLSNYLACQGNP